MRKAMQSVIVRKIPNRFRKGACAKSLAASPVAVWELKVVAVTAAVLRVGILVGEAC
jgi:hypothetical protein